MIGIALALMSAVAFALVTILVRKKLSESDILNVTLIINFVGIIILCPLVFLFTNFRTVSLEGVIYFAIAGMLGFGVARILYYKGMQREGASVNAAIFATYPMYSSIFAVLLLNEALSMMNWVGIVCIIAGVMLIERSLYKPKTGSNGIPKKSLAIIILTTLIAASSQIILKYGLNIYNDPLLGIAIGYVFAFLTASLPFTLSNTKRGLSFVKGLQMFWKEGVLAFIGEVSLFYALSIEKVSIVIPLSQTEPMFILFFSYLYLKGLEKITVKLIIGTLIIVSGAIFVGIR